MQGIKARTPILLLKSLNAGFCTRLFISVSKKLYLCGDMLGLAGV
jgi:hypothetical protein